MPMEIGTAAGIAAVSGAAGTALEGAGMAMGAGGGGGTPRAELPPEMEAQQLEILKDSITALNQEMERTNAVANTLQERGQLMMDVSEGLIPEKEALQRITQQNQQLATRFGEEITGLLNDMSGLGDLEDRLLEGDLEDFRDPVIEREIENNKRILEEEMQRSLGPGWRETEAGQRALQKMNETAMVMRSQGSRAYRQEQLGTYQTVLSGKMGQGQLLFQGRQATMGDLLGGAQQMSGFAGQMLGTSAELGQTRASMGYDTFGMMQQFGSQNLSNEIKDYIGTGNAGFGAFGEDKRTADERFAEAPGERSFNNPLRKKGGQ